jgi:carboxypeptidase Q
VTSLLAPPNWIAGWGVSRLGSASVTNVPEIGLSCEDYGLVFRLAANNQEPVLRVNADAAFLGEVPVANVIGELRGRERPEEYVVLSAHLDSWDAASGATDNGATAAAVMEAMRILKAVVPNPSRTILAGLWSGEEQGFNGSRAFAQDHPEVARGAQAIFDHDNGTGRFVHVSAQGQPASDDFIRRWLSQVPSDIGGPIRVEASDTPSRGIDAFSFSCSGAPAFSFSSVGWEYETYTWHTDLDTFDKIVIDDVRSNAIVLAMLAYLASEDPTRLPRDTPSNPSTPCPAPVRRSN